MHYLRDTHQGWLIPRLVLFIGDRIWFRGPVRSSSGLCGIVWDRFRSADLLGCKQRQRDVPENQSSEGESSPPRMERGGCRQQQNGLLGRHLTMSQTENIESSIQLELFDPSSTVRHTTHHDAEPSSEELIEAMRQDPELSTIHRNRILLKNLPLVVSSIARCGTPMGVRDDCWSVGIQALIKAIGNYDSTRGIPFAAYARYKLKHELRGYLSTTSSDDYGLSESGRKKLSRFRRVKSDKPDLTLRDAASHLGCSQRTIWALQWFSQPPVRISVREGSGASEGEGIEEQIAGNEPNPAALALSKLDAETVVTLLKQRAKPRDWYVLSRLFGLDGNEPKKAAELAKELGLTRSRIDQIAQETIVRFRAFLLRQDRMKTRSGG